MENKLAFTQQFVLEIAADWDSPENICERHGVTAEEYAALLDYKYFQEALAEMRLALTNNAVTASFKAKVAVEDLIPDIYHIAKSSTDEKLQIEAFSQLQKLAGLDKGSLDFGSGGSSYGLQINFIAPSPDTSDIKTVLSVEPEKVLSD